MIKYATKTFGVGGMWIKKLLGYQKFVKFTLEYAKETGRIAFKPQLAV